MDIEACYYLFYQFIKSVSVRTDQDGVRAEEWV